MAWKVPLYKIHIDEQEKNLALEVIQRAMFWANGPENFEFEKELAEKIGSKYCLSFNSGTSALHAVLLAAGVKSGDEVIVPSFTFIATSNSVLMTGAKPVFADIENKSYSLDPESVRKNITDKTKAIMPIHYGGCPAEKIKELREIAQEKNVLLIEDAAESLGASFEGKKVGSFGDAAMFSFCGNKVITSGEGGAIVTNSEEIFEKMKLVRSHGRLESGENYFTSANKMDYVCLGYNYRMPTVIAALALAQLRKLDKVVELRREIAKKYDQAFTEKQIIVPRNDSQLFNVYQMYSIRFNDHETREKVRDHLTKEGIMTKVFFDPVHKTHYYKDVLGYSPNLSVTDSSSDTILTIPIYPNMSENEYSAVIKAVTEVL